MSLAIPKNNTSKSNKYRELPNLVPPPGTLEQIYPDPNPPKSLFIRAGPNQYMLIQYGTGTSTSTKFSTRAAPE